MSTELTKYKHLIEFLSELLGKNYEIVLHWKDLNNSFYLAAIENSEISGRNINSPITGLALDLIKDKAYETKNYVLNYKARSSLNKNILGSTFFIKDENRALIGMLCINFDYNKHLELANNVLKLANITTGLIGVSNDEPTPLNNNHHKKAGPYIAEEFLYSSVEEVIYSVVSPDLLKSGVQLTQEKKIMICNELDKKGIFQIKGTLPVVAELLGVSEPSIYRYLKMIHR